MFLDTTFCVDFLREQCREERGRASRKLESLGEVRVCLSVFALCELLAGAKASSRPETEVARVERFTEFVELVFPDRTFAVVYGETEAALRRKGTPVPTMDLLIGVTAKAHGMPLLTGTTSHFARIPGLVLESY